MAKLSGGDWTALALAGPLALPFVGKGKKNSGMITPPAYTGKRPYGASDVGLGDEVLKPISTHYVKQIADMSEGRGQVGFDPQYSALAKDNLRSEISLADAEQRRRQQSQASAQGLRGGIPVDISNRRYQDTERNLTTGLNNIDIADLGARREDVNRAIYAQPEIVNMGTGIQSNAANFDLGLYNAQMPTYIDQPESNLLPALAGMAGTIGGAYLGGPTGAAIGGGIGNAVGGATSSGGANKSIGGGGDLDLGSLIMSLRNSETAKSRIG